MWSSNFKRIITAADYQITTTNNREAKLQVVSFLAAKKLS